MRLILSLRKALLALILVSVATATLQASDNGTDSLAHNRSPHLYRNLVVGNVVFGAAAYAYFADTWGAPNGKFHVKHELDDNVAMTDEVSHFYAGYKLMDGFAWLFRVLKVPPDKIDRLAALQAALVTTFVEFPMDAYNPSQGLGVTDLAANYSGIGWGLLKKRYPNNFDMKFCVKQPPWEFDHKFLASENKEFDNFIWWGLWKAKYVWTGIGYSTNHAAGDVKSEAYLGVGTTAYDLLHWISPKTADEIKFLDTYFISIRFRL